MSQCDYFFNFVLLYMGTLSTGTTTTTSTTVVFVLLPVGMLQEKHEDCICIGVLSELMSEDDDFERKKRRYTEIFKSMYQLKINLCNKNRCLQKKIQNFK